MKGQTMLKIPFFITVAMLIGTLFLFKKLARALTFGFLFQSRNAHTPSGLPIEFAVDPDEIDIYAGGGC